MVPIPVNEEERLRVLRSYDVMDTPAEQILDDLTALAAGLCDAPIAFVGLMEADRHWFKSRHGVGVTEVPRGITFCAYTIADGRALVVPDAACDPRFEASPLVTEAGIRFYAGVPIRGRGGHLLGTICVADTTARMLSENQLQGLHSLGRQAEAFFELRMVVREGRAANERLSILQEQRDRLTALVVHDLKNPLSAIGLNARYALKSVERPAETQEVLTDILALADRMQRLVNDILDVSRGESGLVVQARDVRWAELCTQLQALFERQLASAQQTLVFSGDVKGAMVRADSSLLFRVLQNLVENALKYSPGRGKITLSVHAGGGSTQIVVADSGPGIPPEHRERIFEPFVRVGDDRSARGQGLGLAFCRLAIEAHGGTITVEQGTAGGASFLIQLPAPGATIEGRPVRRSALNIGMPGSLRTQAVQILPAA